MFYDIKSWCEEHWLQAILYAFAGFMAFWFLIATATWVHSGWAEWHDNHRERITEAMAFESESVAEMQYKEVSAKFRMMRHDAEQSIKRDCYARAVRYMEDNKRQARDSIAVNKTVVEQTQRELNLCMQ